MMYPRPKRSRPAGRPHTPFDPYRGTYFPMGYKGPIKVVTVVAAGHDALLCVDEDQKTLLVAKPWPFRKSSFDGVTLGGVAYASTGLDQRTADEEANESLDPSYFAGVTDAGITTGEKLLAVEVRSRVQVAIGAGELAGVAAGDYEVEWEDVNVAGRRWSGGKDYALLVLDEEQGLSSDIEHLVEFQEDDFSSTGDLFEFSLNRIRVTRDADVRFQGQVGIRDNGNEENAYVKAWLRGPTNSSFAKQIGQSFQGVDDQIIPFGAVAAHGHESPAGGGTVRYLNFGGRLSLSEGDVVGIAVTQKNVNNATWYLTADEFSESKDTWLEAEEV